MEWNNEDEFMCVFSQTIPMQKQRINDDKKVGENPNKRCSMLLYAYEQSRTKQSEQRTRIITITKKTQKVQSARFIVCLFRVRLFLSVSQNHNTDLKTPIFLLFPFRENVRNTCTSNV